MTDDDFKLLINRFLRGDKDAFDSLVTELMPKLLSQAKKMTRGDHDLAEEVVSNTILRLHKSLGTFKTESRFTTWVHAVERSAFLDVLNRYKRKGSMELSLDCIYSDQTHSTVFMDHGPGPHEIAESADRQRVIKKVLSSLPKAHRDAFIEIVLGDSTGREYAEKIGTKDGTVRSRLHRTRHAMMRKMSEDKGLLCGDSVSY